MSKKLYNFVFGGTNKTGNTKINYNAKEIDASTNKTTYNGPVGAVNNSQGGTIHSTISNCFNREEIRSEVFNKEECTTNLKTPEDSLKKIHHNLNGSVEEFYGRKYNLEQLKSQLKENKIIVISGIAGVGKTELTRRFTEKYDHYFSHIVWIDSQNENIRKQCFHSLARKLNIPTNDIHNEERLLKLIVNEIYKRLVSDNVEKNSDIRSLNVFYKPLVSDIQSTNADDDGFIKYPLIIFDNVEKNSDISSLLPDKKSSYTIITSRNTPWSGLTVYELEVFTEEESVNFVSENLKKYRNRVQNNLIGNLVKRVGNLPLCLQQTCCFINEETKYYRQSVEEAIQKYISYFENDPKLFGSLQSVESYERILFITITNVIDKLKGLKDGGEQAIEILCYMSFLNPNNIKKDYFADFKIRSIVYLEMYSLVSASTRNYYSIQRLTQLVVREIVFQDKDFINIIAKTVKLSFDDFEFHKSDINNYLEKHNSNVYDLFLNNNLNVNYKNRYGRTAIFYAVQDNNTDKTRMLINNGADVNFTDNKKLNLLHLSAQYAGTEMIDLFLKEKLDVEVKDIFGNTPLVRAVLGDKTENVEFLLKHGANVNVVNAEGHDALKLSILFSRKEIHNILEASKNKNIQFNSEVPLKKMRHNQPIHVNMFENNEHSSKKIHFNLNEPLKEFYEKKGVLEELKTTLTKKKEVVKLDSPQECFNVEVVKSTEFYDDPKKTKIPTYRTRSEFRGAYLGINNINFENEEKREGADVDGINLMRLFKQIGFKERLYEEDQTLMDMKNTIENFTKDEKYKKVDIVVIAIMSHGKEADSIEKGEIITSDGKFLSVSWVLDQFSNKNCKHLAGKPKIFLFQMCRGEKDMKFIQTDSERRSHQLRDISDTLIAFSTLPGYYSYCDTHRGTWYIEEICRVFMNHAHDIDVESLLKIVDQNLSEEGKEKNIGQTTSYECRGFKRCYLHPGLFE